MQRKRQPRRGRTKVRRSAARAPPLHRAVPWARNRRLVLPRSGCGPSDAFALNHGTPSHNTPQPKPEAMESHGSAAIVVLDDVDEVHGSPFRVTPRHGSTRRR